MLRDQIEQEAASISSSEAKLSSQYAKFASMLVMFKLNEGWRGTHTSLNSYILDLSRRYGRSTQQLYAYITVAEHLLPSIGEEGMNLLGIGKASELVRASRRTKKPITKELIAEVSKPEVTVAQVRAITHQAFELGGELPKGKFVDIGGFFADEEEHRTFVDAVKVSMKLLNIDKALPEVIQRKKIILFWAQEILGTYQAEVDAPSVDPLPEGEPY